MLCQEMDALCSVLIRFAVTLLLRKQSVTLTKSSGALEHVAPCMQNTCKNTVFPAKDPNWLFGLRKVFIFKPEGVIGKSSWKEKEEITNHSELFLVF